MLNSNLNKVRLGTELVTDCIDCFELILYQEVFLFC